VSCYHCKDKNKETNGKLHEYTRLAVNASVYSAGSALVHLRRGSCAMEWEN